MKRAVFIFLYFLIVRVLYVVVSGLNTCELCPDCTWINMLSERALAGDFNFDIGRFIVAPFYNVFIAAHKWIFGVFWSPALITTQILISALSGVYFYKLGKLVFNGKVAMVSTIVFGVFPMTLYWVHTFCTESLFQSLLIISLYFLVKSVKTGSYKDLLISALIFSVVFLTKSHVLLFCPFLVLYLFINLGGSKRMLFPIVYGSICVLATLPFGLYNLKTHDQYILSSNGSKFHFYTGNSEFGYKSIVDVPPLNTPEFAHVLNFDVSYFNGVIHDQIMNLPQKQKQEEYFRLSADWIKHNPGKFAELKVYNLFFFLVPGVSFRHYPFKSWLFSFIVSFPVYLLGYIGLYRSCRSDFKKHSYAFGLFMSMLLFSVIWYVQNRFRVITVEPLYILYSGLLMASFTERVIKYLPYRMKETWNNLQG